MLSVYLNSQFSLMQNLDFVIRILVACLCGFVLGVERSRRFKEAGVRTHMIVCAGAALIMIVSKYGFADLTSASKEMYNGTRGADPARLAAQVVSGVGFLGAGMIFKNGGSVLMKQYGATLVEFRITREVNGIRYNATLKSKKAITSDDVSAVLAGNAEVIEISVLSI